MSETRVQFNTIVSSQLPSYVKEDFPLITEFLSQYYLGQEYQGGPVDLIQNIDRYIKTDNITNLSESVVLSGNLSFSDDVINVSPVKSPSGTQGFPDSYGLLRIGDEIITYTGKTDYSFTGCIRGFVGVTSYESNSNREDIVFSETESSDHFDGSEIQNLSCLFLKEFLVKTKHQLLPGFEDREFDSNLNQNIFLKQSKDFYQSKGTDFSFEILFKSLYNENVSVIKPRDFVTSPSGSQYTVINRLVAEPIEGDPEELINSTLYQSSLDGVDKSYAPVTGVEKVVSVGSTQVFYKIDYDGGYNRDITVDGTVYGNFKVQPTTRVIGDITSATKTIDVDSTVGFSTSGELSVTYIDGTAGIVSYTSKSLNQFYGISNVQNIIKDSSTVGISTFAYGTSVKTGEQIKVRITSVLSNLDLSVKSNNIKPDSKIRTLTLGVSDDTNATRNWIYNICPIYKTSKVEILDSSNDTYKVSLNTVSNFRKGESATLISSNGNKIRTKVSDVLSEKGLVVSGQGALDLSLTYNIQRNFQRANSSLHTEVSNYSTDVFNVYRDNNSDYLVAASSLPFYDLQPIDATDRSVTFSGSFSGSEFLISNEDHGFYTGDAVYYEAETIEEQYTDLFGRSQTRTIQGTGLFVDGIYYIKRVDPFTIKLAKSKNDIFNSNFISLSESVVVNNSKITPSSNAKKVLKSQNIFRKFSAPITDGSINKTLPGKTGIFVNGVELLNYKSKDIVKYGKIENIKVLAEGNDIDVVNTPEIKINSSVGSGAIAHASVTGFFSEILVIDRGFDFVGTPTIKIEGGNGKDAVAEVKLKQTTHRVDFFSDVASSKISIVDSTIGLSTFHKFRNAEKVIYRTSSQKGIVGIVTDATYHVSIVDNETVKLHNTEKDAIAGVGTVSLLEFGEGKHSLESFNKKSILDSVVISNQGSGYQNKKRTCNPSGIEEYSNIVNIKNHDYQSGEIVTYTTSGSVISGLSNNTDYYVTKVDNDSFKLSQVGVTTNKDFYYRTNQYINFASSGVGVQEFNYPKITATLIGQVGISPIGSEDFKGSIEPIVRGSITSVHIENGGNGYGSPDIINLNEQPSVEISFGKNAQVSPVINNGRIESVIVLNSGSGYTSTPDLDIDDADGLGFGAVLVPIIENGLLKSVKVLESGVGYSSDSTSITVISPGSIDDLPIFEAEIQSWRVNLFEKYSNYFTKDDGVLTDSEIDEYGLGYTYLYAPRKLREVLFPLNSSGSFSYGDSDLRLENGLEVDSKKHSPIIGYAYDGNPIYGPYGYKNRDGGIITQMKSGYILKLKEGRPSTSFFPEGFFIDDYEYQSDGSDDILDENNGRYCITPDFPNGTYAYFLTLNDLSDNSGIFAKYKKPVFPYVIGENYHSNPIDFNFDKTSNQDQYDIVQNGWRRNTTPYNLIESDIEYPYINIPNKLSQTSTVKYVSPGKVENIGIVTGGIGYRVGDPLVFDNTDTRGIGVKAKVSRVHGKSISNISVASTTITDLQVEPSGSNDEIVLIANAPHNIANNDNIRISGVSTYATGLDGFAKASVEYPIFQIVGVGTEGTSIGNVSVTGIVTFINIRGDLSKIRENDILKLKTEEVKVLNIDKQSSRIRVLREVNGTVGISHTIGEEATLDSRKIIVKDKTLPKFDYRRNKQIYFNPVDSVGIGTEFGAGIGKTITVSNPGAGTTQVFVPTKAIYLKNHGLLTGDQVTYFVENEGNGIVVEDETNVGTGVSLENGQSLFVAKINDNLIGLSTVRVGLGTTGSFVGSSSLFRDSRTLFFTETGSGDNHSIKTNHDTITLDVNRHEVTVSTATTHGLSSPHNVFVKVKPNTTKTIVVKYNDTNRRLVIDPVTFTSSDVDTTNNTIQITSHNFENGDKIIHTASSPSGGLVSEKIYYAIRVDSDKIKLAETYYGATKNDPTIVNITSASSGTINPINPHILVYNNTKVIFDTSDSSLSFSSQGNKYPAFVFGLYTDLNFTNEWKSSGSSADFETEVEGIVGTSGSKLTLNVGNTVPKVLYYKLNPSKIGNLPDTKSEVYNDPENDLGRKITVKESLYSGTHKISVGIGSTNTFTYTLNQSPEQSSYGASADVSYETDCNHTTGSIAKIDIEECNASYHSLPGVSTVTTSYGSGAILNAESSTIGRAKTSNIDNIGEYFPSDLTLQPTALLPQVIKIEAVSSIDSVGITSFGRGFVTEPNLVLIDGKTSRVISEVDLKVTLGKSEVDIINNTTGMSNVTPIIIPVGGGAGVGISTISFDSGTNIAAATLSVGFSTDNGFPFAVGDKVFVENVSVGVGTTSKGFNSSAYNYTLFPVTSVEENIGGIGTVFFDMSDVLSPGELPGTFDKINSTGKMLAQKHFPIFDVKLSLKDYLKGEIVVSGEKTGTVDHWDSKNSNLIISSNKTFTQGSTIEGKSSKVIGTASSVFAFETEYFTDAKSKVSSGWQNNIGFLNDNMQKVQDSDYYQNFAYSLKSRVPFDTWNDVVSSTNHPTGFKKFSDLQIESTTREGMKVGLTSTTAYTSTVNNLDGFASLNCVYDFDLVSENKLIQDSKSVSNEMKFSSRVLTDYFESIGNRVLSMDDISDQFNSNPRPTPYSVVTRDILPNRRSQKYITYIRDKRYISERQLLIVNLLHDDNFGYINQYGRVETKYDQGSFDYGIVGTEGELRFYPTNSRVNDFDISHISYNLGDAVSGSGSTSIDDVAIIGTGNVELKAGITTTIVSIANTYTSAKVLVTINPNISSGEEFETIELNLVHNGSDIELLEYGRLSTNIGDMSLTGLGTFIPYLDYDKVKIDFKPETTGIGTVGNINTIHVGLATNSTTGVGTIHLDSSSIEALTTNITSQTPTTVAQYTNDYDAAYFIVQVADVANNHFQMSEIVIVDDYYDATQSYDVYSTEFGNIETSHSLGIFEPSISNTGVVSLNFTPTSSSSTVVTVYMNALSLFKNQDSVETIDFNNGFIDSKLTTYVGTQRDVKRSFNLTSDNFPLFEKQISVDINNNTINAPNHYFVTGEKIKYSYIGTASSAIEIAQASFVGYANTTFLPPENLYVLKVDDDTIKIATSAQNALKSNPETITFTSVGTATSQRFISLNQNARAVVSIDNVIQSPIVSTAITTHLEDSVNVFDNLFEFSGITSFFGGDLIKIDDEIVKIESIGVGETNIVRVIRPWMGTAIADHSTDSVITKIEGQYNIIDSQIHFVDAPYGNTPIGSTTNSPNERDWEGITESSSFHGRSFLRSGTTNGANDAYHKNYIFDDVSSAFDGETKSFDLKQNGVNITNISNENAIILVNGIFQSPGLTNQYTLGESSGITSITFNGTNPSPLGPDIGISKYPKGGIILSVGSTEGFGYQPLVSAGGTAVVSNTGTIQSISIGNSGSGYRSGVQSVSVGVGTTGSKNIEIIGTASITDGNVVSVTVTNPGSNYSQTNPPYVVFDAPLSYSNIPLIYSSESTSGLGTYATVDIVVGQGSSVIDFKLNNTGYGYGNGEILTVPIGGTTGIPTTSDYSNLEFQLTVDEIFNDTFNSWSIGVLQILDSVEDYIDGERVDFPLQLSGQSISIVSASGSNIKVQDVLLVFVNDILQVPGEGYLFEGGSIITFTEAPRLNDTIKIVFYKGSGDNDVAFREVIRTIKEGDKVQLISDPSIGQAEYFTQNERTVEDVTSTNTVDTNTYIGQGISNDSSFTRTSTWCRQTEDLFINQKPVSKDRLNYEPRINSTTNIINNVGVGETIVYVENIRPIFNSQNENIDSLTFQNKIKLVTEKSKTVATATAIVADDGTISSISVSDSGSGYESAPLVTIQSVGSGVTATATSNLSSGTVSSILISNPGSGYTNTNPPVVLIEPPSSPTELCDVLEYAGDSGIIVGFGTTTLNGKDEAIFELLIPYDSDLRNENLVGTAVTLSALSVDDYFTVSNSNTNIIDDFVSLNTKSTNGNLVGVATHFTDAVHQVTTTELVYRNISGITTGVLRVNSVIAGIGTTNFTSSEITMDSDTGGSVIYRMDSDSSPSGFDGGITTSTYFGDFSWGKVILTGRNREVQYDSNNLFGFSGITNADSISRDSNLRFNDYTI